MNTGTILLGIYVLSVIAWIVFIFGIKSKNRTSTNNKTGWIFALISIPFAPICWIAGLCVILAGKKKKDRPLPLPKSLQGKLKKDCVSYNGKVMSIAEVNRITGKNYTLEDVYG